MGEQRTYVRQTGVGHSTTNLACSGEEREEFVVVKQNAHARSGACYLRFELEKPTEEGEMEHLLVGIERICSTQRHTVEIGFKGVVGFESKRGGTFFESKTREVFIEFAFDDASRCCATCLCEVVGTFKNGFHAGVVPTTHEFTLCDGLAVEQRTEEVVEDVAACGLCCGAVASLKGLIEGAAGADVHEKQRSGCNGEKMFMHLFLFFLGGARGLEVLAFLGVLVFLGVLAFLEVLELLVFLDKLERLDML